MLFLTLCAGAVVNYGWILYQHGALVDIARDAARFGATQDHDQIDEILRRINMLLTQARLDPADYVTTAGCVTLHNAPRVDGIEATLQRRNASCFFLCTAGEPNPTARAVFRLERPAPHEDGDCG